MVTITERATLRGRNQQTVRVDTDTGGDFIARGLQQLGGGLDSMAKAVEFRDTIKAEADARDALNEYRDQVRSGLYDPQTGYLNQTGKNALGEGRKNTFNNLREARTNIASRLSPKAQKEFARQADALDNGAKDTAIRHEGVELRGYTLEQFEASAQGYLNDAVLEPTNDEKYTQNLARAELELRRAATLTGKSQEQIDLDVERLRQSAEAGRVIALANDSAINAWNYMEANKEKLAPDVYAKLKKDLKPAADAAFARDWVGINNATMTEGDDQYGVPSWLAAAESGNNPLAEAETSSATGRVQFLEDTYLRYVQKVRAAGGAKWAEGMTREQILETRKNPAQEGEIYRAFRADNQRALEGAGYDVNPRNEYLMHHFGQGVALAVLDAERFNNTAVPLRQLLQSAGVNADQWIEANPWMKGKSVGQALNWMAGKAGGSSSAPIGTTSGSRSAGAVNRGQQYQDALLIEDLDRRAAVLRELNLRGEIEQMARAEAERIAREQAYDIIDKGGAPSEIPADLQVEIGAAGMNEIFDVYERNLEGVDFTDEETFDTLYTTATKDPKTFAGMDLNAYRPQLSRSDYRSLREMQLTVQQTQQQMEQDPAAAVYKDTDYRQAASDADERIYAAMGVKPGGSISQEEQQRVNALRKELWAVMDNFAKTEGRPMTFTERQAALDKLLLPAYIEGVDLKWGPGTGTFVFDVPAMNRTGFELQADIGMVPAPDQVRIEKRLEKSLGRKPKETEIVEAFENEVLLSMGVSPTMEFGEIPRDIRRRLLEEEPGLSEQEAVDLYLNMLLGEGLRRGVE